MKAWYGLGADVSRGGGGFADARSRYRRWRQVFAHVVTYFVLAGWFGLLASKPAALVMTIVGLTLFGVLLELLQGMTGYRYAEWADVAANVSGTLIGVFAGLPDAAGEPAGTGR